MLNSSGVKSIRLPRKSPDLNPFSECWVRSAREMCIDRMIFFGEESLRHAVAEMEIYYNQERAQQWLGNKIIRPEFSELTTDGEGEHRSRLGGLMNCFIEKQRDSELLEFWDMTEFRPPVGTGGSRGLSPYHECRHSTDFVGEPGGMLRHIVGRVSMCGNRDAVE